MVRVGRRREGGDGGKEGQDKGKSRGVRVSEWLGGGSIAYTTLICTGKKVDL